MNGIPPPGSGGSGASLSLPDDGNRSTAHSFTTACQRPVCFPFTSCTCRSIAAER